MLGDILRERRQIEGVSAALNVQSDQSRQRNECTETKIESDLEGRIILLSASTPYPNHDECGHQGQFMEEIKQEEVQRSECAEDSARHDQQQNIKFLFARFDFPGNAGSGKSNNRSH